ncbi:UNVERIFIED_CONTAM: hypothetical protein FKN15_014134 [Acipenser sinensis]
MTHTRLLSMRLVFEDGWMSGSNCLSVLWEDEGIYGRSSPCDPQPLTPSVRTGSRWETLPLEWDPSVDVGESTSHDDTDDSYFSTITGLHHFEVLSEEPSTKRSSSMSSLRFHMETDPAEVFEDVWMSRSNCLWEDEGIYDRSSPCDPQPLTPSVRTGSRRDSLPLEWDPSVDVGESTSHDDTDSSYFSTITGLHHFEVLSEEPSTKRSSSLSSLRFHMETDPAESSSVEWRDTRQPVLTAVPGALVLGVSSEVCSSSFVSAGHCPATEPFTFDPERICAWLGQTEPALEHTRNFSEETDGRADYGKLQALWVGMLHFSGSLPFLVCCPPRLNRSEEIDPARSGHLLWVLKTSLSYRLVRVALLVSILLGVRGVISQILVSWKYFSSHHTNNFARSVHVMLHYVNGPPPT